MRPGSPASGQLRRKQASDGNHRRTGHDLVPSTEAQLDRNVLAFPMLMLARVAELTDLVLVAEELRIARQAIDRISGRAGVEDLLDALFGRFCLGK